ncbi:MetQ/NlpA family ABC transporter substrate-binding protein [Aeribacillus composti]|uniref:MetQ/NlpA family ABC transporter substrate-binding protein n=1 Tax=Aeribacillus composti TaxID=1868734 RepID=UPI002E228D99|nr:MetQ/NlpA family ABC transporter substrate-binding protein [Aeribacillus composti]
MHHPEKIKEITIINDFGGEDKMKRLSYLFYIICLMVLISGCGKATNAGEDKDTLVIATNPSFNGFPEILEFIKPKLKEEGIDLKIEYVNDIIQPNELVHDKSVDANAFQHIPYMEAYNKQHGTNLVAAIKVLAWPSGLYSKRYKDIKDVPDGATISIPQDPSNNGRALDFLAKHGFIKLKEGVGLQATKKDIIENKRNFKIIELDQGMSAKSLDDVDLAFILGGYQTAVGLHLKDALLAEDSSSEFIGVITTRPDNQNDEKIQKLKKVLHTPEVKKFIEETFHGDIIPVFE